MNHRNGFTLVELLVATMILALLASAGFAALSAGTSSAMKTKRYGAMMAHGQAALQAITTDIRAAVEHDKFRLMSLDAEYHGMDADTIDFIVAGEPQLTHEEPELSQRCEVGYYVENDRDTDMKWLLRREDGSLDEDPLEGGALSLAGPFVAALNVQFYDGLFWQSGWDDQTQWPKVVFIQIVVVDEDEFEEPMVFSTTVPIMAQ